MLEGSKSPLLFKLKPLHTGSGKIYVRKGAQAATGLPFQKGPNKKPCSLKHLFLTLPFTLVGFDILRLGSRAHGANEVYNLTIGKVFF